MVGVVVSEWQPNRSYGAYNRLLPRLSGRRLQQLCPGRAVGVSRQGPAFLPRQRLWRAPLEGKITIVIGSFTLLDRSAHGRRIVFLVAEKGGCILSPSPTMANHAKTWEAKARVLVRLTLGRRWSYGAKGGHYSYSEDGLHEPGGCPPARVGRAQHRVQPRVLHQGH